MRFIPLRYFAHSHYGTKEQSNSILRLGDWIVENGIDAPGDFRSARDLLLMNPPRLSGGPSLTAAPGQDVVDLACRLGLALDHSILPIQGPPGAGKTFTGARMICELIRNGRTVGVTAIGHKVIRKLLDEVVEAARELGIPGVSCAHKTDGDGSDSGTVREIGANDEALDSLQTGSVNVLGGTPWLWSRADFMNSVDVLFVDEKPGKCPPGQCTGMRPGGPKSCYSSAIPQQLEQPQQGSHPEGSDISALAPFAKWQERRSPKIVAFFSPRHGGSTPPFAGLRRRCFTSNASPLIQGLNAQQIDAPGPFSGAGLWYLPVAHEGNQSYSIEEIRTGRGIGQIPDGGGGLHGLIAVAKPGR